VLAASITWRKEYQERLGGAAADEALEMRFWGIFCVALLTLPAGAARAETRTVRSGVTTPIHTYLSWNNDCSPNTGVVKVATRPQHGKLTPRKVTAVARQNRFSSYGTVCLGKSMPGFEVDYTSTPGYRGTDSFAIEVIYGNRNPILDTYTVTVE
jgi:hypothetical protein